MKGRESNDKPKAHRKIHIHLAPPHHVRIRHFLPYVIFHHLFSDVYFSGYLLFLFFIHYFILILFKVV